MLLIVTRSSLKDKIEFLIQTNYQLHKKENIMTLMKRNHRRTFPTIWDNFFRDDWFDLRPSTLSSTVPSVNVKEHTDGFELELAVPGMNKEDFKLNLDKNVLTISAEMHQSAEDSDDTQNYRRKEFSYQSFSRSFTLPDSVASDQIGATYIDGILSVSLPKKEEAKEMAPKVIEVA